MLAGIRRLLHDEGMTIRGVQKVLRDHGIRHVAGLSAADISLPDVSEAEDSIEAQLAAALGPMADMPDEAPETAQIETAQIIALETVLAQKDAARAAEESPPLRRNLFDLDAAPEQSNAPPAAPAALVSPAPQAPGIPDESAKAVPRGLIAAKLRQAQRAGGLPDPAAVFALSARIVAMRDRLAEGARKKPR